MDNLLFIANYFYNFGFNVTCITNEVTGDANTDGPVLKNPCHKWDDYSFNRQKIEVLRSYPWEKAKGVGVALGFDKLRALDIDYCNDFSVIEDFLKMLRLPPNYEWVVKSGSQKGFHIIFYADDHQYSLVKSKIKVFKSNEIYENFFRHIELRWIGHLVLPPSIHPSINEYQFWNKQFPENGPKKVHISYVHDLIKHYCAIQSSRTISLQDEQYIESYEEDQYFEVSGSGHTARAPWYVFFDTETTGQAESLDISPLKVNSWPRLVQLSWIICDCHGNIESKHSEIIKPVGYEIPLQASKIHGITTAKALSEGKDIEKILYEFTTLGGRSNRYLIGHNVIFDINVILAEFHRLYNDIPQIDSDTICTMTESTSFCKIGQPGRYKWPKLEELHKKIFGCGYQNMHQADSDAEATMKCYWQMRDIGVLKRPPEPIEGSIYPFFYGKLL